MEMGIAGNMLRLQMQNVAVEWVTKEFRIGVAPELRLAHGFRVRSLALKMDC